MVDDTEITRVPMYLRARNFGISYLPQEPSVFRKLTVEENILAVLEAQPLGSKERRTRTEKLIHQLNSAVSAPRAVMRSAKSAAGRRKSRVASASSPTSSFSTSPSAALTPSPSSNCKKSFSTSRPAEPEISSSPTTMCARRSASPTGRTLLLKERYSSPAPRRSWAITSMCGGFTWARASRWVDRQSNGFPLRQKLMLIRKLPLQQAI